MLKTRSVLTYSIEIDRKFLGKTEDLGGSVCSMADTMQATTPRRWYQKRQFLLPVLLAGILVVAGAGVAVGRAMGTGSSSSNIDATSSAASQLATTPTAESMSACTDFAQLIKDEQKGIVATDEIRPRAQTIYNEAQSVNAQIAQASQALLQSVTSGVNEYSLRNGMNAMTTACASDPQQVNAINMAH